MSNFYYAQIAANTSVEGVSSLSAEVVADNMVPITETQFNDSTTIGKTWNGSTFGAPLADDPVTTFTRLAFRNRFTMVEKQAIYTAAETVVDIRIFLDDLASASNIDITNAQTAGGVNALETAGLIGTGRATEILTP